MKKIISILGIVCSLTANASAQIITTVAGNDIGGYSGDGSLAIMAELNFSEGVAIDGSGNIYIADNWNNRIRKVNNSGIINTIAGNGTPGFSGDGGAATEAEIYNPTCVAVDGTGNVYFSDWNNCRIRKISTTGVITTVVGNGYGSTGDGGYSGDGGAATSAEISKPNGIAFDGSGNMYFADSYNNVVRKVNTSGIISTIAGNGVGAGTGSGSTGNGGYSGDGGTATAAELNLPQDVAIDNTGDIYIADFDNNRIRKVNTLGIINTIAGNGTGAYSGDGSPATAAELNGPFGVAVDGADNIYIADQENNIIRKVNTSGIITTMAGNGTEGYSGDGGAANGAELNHPTAISIDGSGNLYIADLGNNLIRKVTSIATGARTIKPSKNIINLFPNPNSGKITVRGLITDESKQVITTVINVSGQILYYDTVTLQNGALDKSIVMDVPNGIYFLQVNTEKDNGVMQFTVTR